MLLQVFDDGRVQTLLGSSAPGTFPLRLLGQTQITAGIGRLPTRRGGCAAAAALRSRDQGKHHAVAVQYLKFFASEGVSMFLATVAAGEFHLRQPATDLPLDAVGARPIKLEDGFDKSHFDAAGQHDFDGKLEEPAAEYAASYRGTPGVES